MFNWDWHHSDYYGNPFRITGIGVYSSHDNGISIDWRLRQIIWNIRETKYTRAMEGGIGLAPARTWFMVTGDKPATACLQIHITFPGACFDAEPFWLTDYPLGSFKFSAYPQNNYY